MAKIIAGIIHFLQKGPVGSYLPVEIAQIGGFWHKSVGPDMARDP